MSIIPTGSMAIAPPTEQMRELTATQTQLRRQSETPGAHVGIRQRQWGIAARVDSSVTFEEYKFWAKIERQMEEEEHRRRQEQGSSRGLVGGLKSYFSKNPYQDEKPVSDAVIRAVQPHEFDEKDGKGVEVHTESGTVSPVGPAAVEDFDAEWRTAARALRTAGWFTVFYLITTDILGWGATPYTFSSVGYGLGVGIFVLMGLAAGASGFFIWRTFIGLDSSRYPMMSFGDPFFRLYGPKTRHFINVLQAFQMFCSVAVIILSNGQIFNQLVSFKICFIVCLIIPLVVGIISGFMRALKHLGWFCNLAVWLNITSFIIICVAAAKYGPDPSVAVGGSILPKEWATNPAPVKTFLGTPPAIYQESSHVIFAAQFSGIDSMVYSFSGALLFVAFLSEMRRPMDFWKGMICAQAFITVVYVFFGAFVYTYYGQYSYSLINQVVSTKHGLQVVSNVLALLTALLAVFLYFNVGFKVVYLEVGQELLGFPPYGSKRGKIMWYTIGPFYWILAFIVASSIPQFEAVVNFIGGLLSLNFTYSIPGFMYAAYKIQDGAALDGEGFDPYTGVTTRHDSGMKRHWRGLKKTWYISIPVVIFTCLGLASSGMGTWAAILGLEAAFSGGGTLVTSWGCTPP